eukprot:COSAG06_NODE_6592_length_2863_cov_6.879136_1_plen_167_part_10
MHRAEFAEIDANADGVIEPAELKAHVQDVPGLQDYTDEQVDRLIRDEAAWDEVVHAMQQKGEWDQFYASIPPDLQAKIEKFDKNKDGQFDLVEVAQIFDALHATEQKGVLLEEQARNWRNALTGAIVALILLVIFTFVSATAANEWTKELHVDQDGTIVSTEGSVLH